MKLQVKYFPLVTCTLWGILSLDRISDDLSLIFKFTFSSNNSLLNFNKFLTFMHNFLGVYEELFIVSLFLEVIIN